MSLNREKKGLLWFYDSGKKFLGEKHALTNLTRENDICVYSLTPKGENQPKYLIAKVTQAGEMQKQLDGTAEGLECIVVMQIMEYDMFHPMNLFTITKRLNAVLCSNVIDNVKVEFLRQNGSLLRNSSPSRSIPIPTTPELRSTCTTECVS